MMMIQGDRHYLRTSKMVTKTKWPVECDSWGLRTFSFDHSKAYTLTVRMVKTRGSKSSGIAFYRLICFDRHFPSV